jgi:glutamate 5-kinase
LVSDISGPEIPEALWQAAGGSDNRLGTGGMATKLQAADLARRSGATVIIARGSDANVIARLVAGETLGTCFRPVETAVESRKRYLLAGGRLRDRLVVDEGALQALRSGGSLLPVGVFAVEGNFGRGDTVRVLDQQGREIARGLVNYSSTDLRRICGRHSSEIEKILGFVYGDEVIHRNNLVLL